MLLAGPLAGVHLGRFVARFQLLGQLGKGQAKLRLADPFRFLPEEFVAEDVELLRRIVFSRSAWVSAVSSAAMRAWALGRSVTAATRAS